MRLGIYQHYKGQYYQVIGVARHCESLEELIVYQALYGDYRLWVRPKSMFNEKITHDSKEIFRFKFVCEALSQAPSPEEDEGKLQ